jgi:hypothetical protein
LFARKVERPANVANCGVVENAYGNEPKNGQQSHASPPLRAYPVFARRNLDGEIGREFGDW